MIAGIVDEHLFWLMGEGGLDCYIEAPEAYVTQALMNECQGAYDEWMDDDDPCGCVYEWIKRKVLDVKLSEYKVFFAEVPEYE